MTPEAKVKAKVDKIVEAKGGFVTNPIGTMYGKSGTSDKLICLAGLFIAVECKTTEARGASGKPTTLQYKYLDRVLSAGGLAAAVNESNLREFNLWLSDILQGHPRDAWFGFAGTVHPSVGSIPPEIGDV